MESGKTGQDEAVKVLLVGLDTDKERDFASSMEELAGLAEAAGKQVAGVVTQRMDSVNKALYIGTGKVREVCSYAAECGAAEVIFDNALTPSQVRNLNRELGLPVLDRTNLILDLFALRARTREAKLQVEAARLQYILPRLVGMREDLGRQGGTGGSMSNKGAGETRLELDRRRIEHRISELRKELKEVAKNRQTMRKSRSRSGIPQVALVGYTNAGKSTILNRMGALYGESGKKAVLEKDMLFATLDTSVRRMDLGDNKPFFLVDTVGFIRNLPHGLIEAFRSTLEEVCCADLLVQVVDYSDQHYREQIETTEKTLQELGAADIPRLTVYNKADKCGMEGLPKRRERQIYLAAACGVGLKELGEMIQGEVYAHWQEACFLFPYDRGSQAAGLMGKASVLEQEYREEGLWLKVRCHSGDCARYEAYRCGESE